MAFISICKRGETKWEEFQINNSSCRENVSITKSSEHKEENAT